MSRKMLHIAKAATTAMAGLLTLVISMPAAHADSSSDLLATINDARASAGRPALVADATLTAAARQWSAQMASRGALADANVASMIPAGWSKVGENVASGGNVAAIFNAWQVQPDHNAVMLDPAFTLTGVAVVAGSNGVLYASEFLEGRKAPTTTTTTTTVAKTTTTSTATTTTTTSTVTTTTLATTGLGNSTVTTAPFGTASPIALGPVHNAGYGATPWIFAVGGGALALLGLIGAGFALRGRRHRYTD